MPPPKASNVVPTEQHIFARRLREARRESGLTQARLAELSGLDRTYISHLERGLANPSLLKMSQLARIVGKSVADLLRG
ncbi:helix-turn-helix transcriptional regulator [Caenibius sp. WL]|uniref:helix-turn-helix transcriptional regulator n=1 Tax=Caenibius sp. WL TaxID=2872646 RepID=UPI001E70F034|nr:helix-turn-helix transcriptional regulator [Caenibius sp. WL]QZP08977.1 helix-turn-helix domain-containing protein [Caenibius sp. WL]